MNNTLEVGDSFYVFNCTSIYTVKGFYGIFTIDSLNRYYASNQCCRATKENYEMLCKLFPNLVFQEPI